MDLTNGTSTRKWQMENKVQQWIIQIVWWAVYSICYAVEAKCYSRFEILNIWIEYTYRTKMFFNTISGRWPDGKRRRWTEAVLEDCKILGIRNWKGEAMNRQVRRGLIQETKVWYQAGELQKTTKIRAQTCCLFWLIDIRGRKKDHCR